jgi:hypothetical protein
MAYRRHDYREERIGENLGIYSRGGFDTLGNTSIPTIPSVVRDIRRSVSKAAGKLATLPLLDEIPEGVCT